MQCSAECKVLRNLLSRVDPGLQSSKQSSSTVLLYACVSGALGCVAGLWPGQIGLVTRSTPSVMCKGRARHIRSLNFVADDCSACSSGHCIPQKMGGEREVQFRVHVYSRVYCGCTGVLVPSFCFTSFYIAPTLPNYKNADPRKKLTSRLIHKTCLCAQKQKFQMESGEVRVLKSIEIRKSPNETKSSKR